MSVKTSARVWEHSQAKGSSLLLMLALADFANDDGYSYPGVVRLSSRCRMSTRNTQLVIADLIDMGELYVAVGGGRHLSSEYVILVGRSEEEMASSLVHHLHLTALEASAIAREAISAQEATQKGEKFSPFYARNGEAQCRNPENFSGFPEAERVKPSAERVKPASPDPLDPLDPLDPSVGSPPAAAHSSAPGSPGSADQPASPPEAQPLPPAAPPAAGASVPARPRPPAPRPIRPAPKPSAKQRIQNQPPAELVELVAAICAVIGCEYDHLAPDDPLRGEIVEFARGCLQTKHTPAHVRAFPAWARGRWPWKNGDPISLRDLRRNLVASLPDPRKTAPARPTAAPAEDGELPARLPETPSAVQWRKVLNQLEVLVPLQHQLQMFEQSTLLSLAGGVAQIAVPDERYADLFEHRWKRQFTEAFEMAGLPVQQFLFVVAGAEAATEVAEDPPARPVREGVRVRPAAAPAGRTT